jgi:N-acetylglucosamine-6-phosphate deacetylase
MAEEVRNTDEVVETPDGGDVHSEELNAQRIAARMGLEGKKGVIAPSASADIIVFEDNWQIDSVFSKGDMYVEDGTLIRGGFFENLS